MSVPLALRPQAVRRLFEVSTAFSPYLATKYWDITPNRIPGPNIEYDLLTGSRQRPMVTSRGAPARYQDPDVLTVVTLPAETMRDGSRISAEEFSDWRDLGDKAGEARGVRAVQRRMRQLKTRYHRFLEWQAAAGLSGHKQFRPPSAEDIHYDELLLCSETYLDGTVGAAWNSAPATEAAARTLLASIHTDLVTAKTSVATNSDCIADTMLLSEVTAGYLNSAAIVAGLDSGLSEMVLVDGAVTRFCGLTLDIYPSTYIHPVTGTSTRYIPTNEVIILDSNNKRAGRQLVVANACDVEAPDAFYDVFIKSWIVQESPGSANITIEWSGAPCRLQDGDSYVYTDVTAT